MSAGPPLATEGGGSWRESASTEREVRYGMRPSVS